jgi:hypothetical protein
MGRYPYEKLDASKHQFRLFILYPRTSLRPEDLRITIFEDSLDDEDRKIAKGFQALSYVWGDATQRQDLMVIVLAGEIKVVCKLSVTANLAEALVHYPFRDNHVLLWSDAICINQDDHEERAQQVQLMQRIYSKADTVTAWLGPEADSSNLAMNLLTRIGESVDVDMYTKRVTKRAASPWLTKSAMDNGYTTLLLDCNFPIPWDGPEAQALEALFNRPWFERLWIRQEVILGGERTALLCGGSSIMWSTFRKAAYVLSEKRVEDAHPDKVKWMMRTHFVSCIWFHDKGSLQSLMRDLRKTTCSDPRDRVYGALGVLPFDSLGIIRDIKPDYTKSAVEVYRDLVIADMTINGRADLLVECYTSSDPTWALSWVPNWSTNNEGYISILEACADGQSAVAATLCPDQKTLSIKGKLVATVSDVWEPLLTLDNMHLDMKMSNLATLAAVKECAQRIALSARYPGGGDNLEALCIGLSGGHVVDNFAAQVQMSSTCSIAQYKTFINFALSSAGIPSETQRLTDLGIGGCTGNANAILRDSMVATAEGYLGFCPAAARRGDRVCILLGCMKPMILRPTTDNNSCYTVVGPCNMHGLNWGEGLLGPLPGDTTFVWNRSGPRDGVGPAFKDRHTGEETIVDPRIDWDLLNVGNDREQAFAFRMALDGSRMDYFKRPDAEYFEKKGIELTTFNLV